MTGANHWLLASSQGSQPDPERSVYEMNIKRYKPVILPAAVLLLYLIAIWAEAAYFASTIEFNELLTCRKLLPAFAAVRWEHIQKLATVSIPMEIVTVVGLLATISTRLSKRYQPARAIVAIYAAILLLAGGWMGLLALPLMLQPWDGECLDEGMTRMAVCGVWTLVVLIHLAKRFMRNKNHTEQTPAGDVLKAAPEE